MKRIALCTLLALTPVLAQAQLEDMSVGVAAKLSTLGFGGEVGVALNEQFSLRAGLNMFSYEYEFEEADEVEEIDEITGKLDLQTIPLLVDWHPGGAAFRISAGIVINNNEISLTVEPQSIVEIDDVEYQVDRFDGDISFGQVAPYVGIGVGRIANADGNWHFALDLGVMFQGEPEIDLSATATDPLLQASLNTALDNEEADVEDDVEDFTIWPVIAITLGYSF